MNPGRLKVYPSLIHINITLSPADLARLDTIPGNSRNERICKLLDVYETAEQAAQCDTTDTAAICAAFRFIQEALGESPNR